MLKRRLQNRIAESRWALPLTALYGIAIVVALGAVSQKMWAQTTLLALSALLITMLNNTYTLIRIYSRMIGCSFIVLTLTAPFLFPSVEGAFVGLLFIAFYFLILRTYQNGKATGIVYFAFLAIGVASLFFVQILYYVPIFWFLMSIRLQSLNLRTFCASLFAIATPYWFLVPYYFYKADYQTPLLHFSGLADFTPWNPFDADFCLAPHQLITFAFILLLVFTGMIHFIRQRSRDRLRIQLTYEIFLSITIFTVIFLVLQPQHYDFLLRILIIHTAVFIGHFIALTQTKITNIAFIAILVLTLALTAFNLVHSSQFIIHS